VKTKKQVDYSKHSSLIQNIKKSHFNKPSNIYNMEQQFITENEKAKLTEFRQREEQIVIGLGQIEYQIQSLELDKDSLTEQLSQLRKDQYTLGQQMTETYGDGNVDLNTGEFTKA